MITVKEILNLTLFKNFELLTDKDYLNNRVTTVVILEYESSKIQYSGYGPGYFVLASYFFAAINPELINNSLKLLIQRHVSGIAIKMTKGNPLPAELIELAKKEKVPLMIFYEEFMEDLIITINESMKTRAEYIIQEEKLNNILNEKYDEDNVKKIALEINPYFKNKIICASLISKTDESNLKLHTNFDKIMYYSSKLNENLTWTFVKNGHSIILICSFSEEEIENLHILSYLKSILQGNGFTDDAFYIGYDLKPVEIGKLRESIIKSKMAAAVCKLQNKSSLSYNYVGIYKYIITLIQNEIMFKEIKERISILEEYDAAHDTNLLKTLISYVKNNGDYTETSKECFQHSNTIRYRIKKAEELLDLEEETAEAEITILIRCYPLLNLLETT